MKKSLRFKNILPCDDNEQMLFQLDEEGILFLVGWPVENPHSLQIVHRGPGLCLCRRHPNYHWIYRLHNTDLRFEPYKGACFPNCQACSACKEKGLVIASQLERDLETLSAWKAIFLK